MRKKHLINIAFIGLSLALLWTSVTLGNPMVKIMASLSIAFFYGITFYDLILEKFKNNKEQEKKKEYLTIKEDFIESPQIEFSIEEEKIEPIKPLKQGSLSKQKIEPLMDKKERKDLLATKLDQYFEQKKTNKKLYDPGRF